MKRRSITKMISIKNLRRMRTYTCSCVRELTLQQQINLKENLGFCDRLIKNYYWE